MKKEITVVPVDICPLDYLSKLGDRTKNSWIFLHRNVIKKLMSSADALKLQVSHDDSLMKEFYWHETSDCCETAITFEYNNINKEWLQVLKIKAEDIAFSIPANDPEEIFFLKMEE